MPLVLTEVLSHLELTGAVQVDQVLVVSTSPTSLLLSRESGPLLPNGESETSSEGLLARAEPNDRDAICKLILNSGGNRSLFVILRERGTVNLWFIRER